MKKILALAASLMLVCSLAFADTTNVVTNMVGQIITTISDNQGVRSTTVTYPSQPASASQVYLKAIGFQLDPIANATTTNTLYTPRQLGDMLIGHTGSVGVAWIATGLTTSDWKQITD